LKNLIESFCSTGKIERQILDLAHRHLHRTRASPNESVPVACKMGADRRRDGTKNHNSFSGATDLDAPNLKTGKHRVYAGACGIFHPRGEVVDSWERADSGSTRGFIPRFLYSEDQGSTLRIGESDNLPEQMISCIRLEISTCRPRICSISGGQFPLEFEKLVFVCASRAKVANVISGDLIERLGQHQTITCRAGGRMTP
jgi:hypothetical protein